MTVGEEEELDLGSLSRLVWRHRRLVAVASVIGALFFGIVVFLEEPYFRAVVTVTEARDRGMGGMSPLAEQLGGLASLAGVNLNPAALGAAQQSAAVLESRYLAEEFIRRNGLLPILQREPGKTRTLWRAVERFKKGVLTIRRDLRKGVTTVTVEWNDPVTAARWANAYVALANELLRNRALEETSHNIAYLNEQVAKTNDLELRKVMYNLMENETKTAMVANGRPDYAFEVVDPAVAPELKAGPHRLLMTLVGLVLGFFVGAVGALVLDRLGRQRHLVAGAGGARSQ